MNESWKQLLEGDAAAALAKYRTEADPDRVQPGTVTLADLKRIERAIRKRQRKAVRNR